MFFIFFSRLSGNLDDESTLLLFNTLSSFFSEISVLNLVHSDDQCQILNFFLESVSDHDGWVKIVEGGDEVHVSVSSSSEEANDNEFHDSGFLPCVGSMSFVDIDDFFLFNSVSSVFFWLFLFGLLSRNIGGLLRLGLCL